MKTDENLEHVLLTVASALTKFLAYEKKAEEEGYHQVARFFRAMAATQRVYTANLMKIAGKIGKTDENLSSIIDDKTYAVTQLYPTFAEQANTDGNPMASAAIQAAINTTRGHLKVLNAALENLGRNKELIYWVCGTCGNLESGEEPVTCKICGAARDKFIKSE